MTVRQRKSKPKTKPITTIEMEVAIANFFGYRQNIIVPNISWGLGMHECDMFIVSKARYCTEAEIKRSKSDLLADFEKGHHHKDRKNRIKEFYYAIPKSLLETCEPLIPKDIGIIICEKSEYRDYVYAHIHRKTKPNLTAIRLTEKELHKVAHLGTMRIWSLKNKIIKLQTDVKKTKKGS